MFLRERNGAQFFAPVLSRWELMERPFMLTMLQKVWPRVLVAPLTLPAFLGRSRDYPSLTQAITHLTQLQGERVEEMEFLQFTEF